MKSCGIITEYNPFHNGHAYQLKKAREKTNADVVVVVMSGNTVQRGEFALIDKKLRTKLALSNGADLVIELPWFCSIEAADIFGSTAVSLLKAMHIDYLCFGTDYDASFNYKEFVEKENKHQEQITNLFKEINKKYSNWSYPKRASYVYKQIFHEDLDFKSPNHILGISYARANYNSDGEMKLVPIERVGASHYDDLKGNFASGTMIRKRALNKTLAEIKDAVPNDTYQMLTKNKLHTLEEYFVIFKSRIITMSLEELRSIYQITEGIEQKIKDTIYNCNSFAEWLNKMKSSRYTTARLQRIAIYILLNIKKQDIEYALNNKYLKILGFNEKGQKYLKNEFDLPKITSIRSQNLKLKEFEQKIEEMYHLFDEKNFSFAKDYKPIIIK